MARSRTLLVAAAAVILVGVTAEANARTWVVHDGESIQDAVDAASPGDTIRVRPGTYTGVAGEDSVVEIRKNDITLRGSRRAVIDATGHEYGVMVGEDEPIVAAGCPPITVTGFEINGFTVQNATDTGLRLSGVEDFVIRNGTYLDNEEYGPFPVCSRNGVIKGNFASGHNDAAIYVGDDVNVHVINNVATDSVVGAEIENSVGSLVRGNVFIGNTGGLLVFVLPGLPQPFTHDVLITENLILGNNRTNTGGGAVAAVPEGSGLLIIGSDNVTVERNVIANNDSFGFASIGNINFVFDPRIEPFTDDLRVERNIILGNGANPDPLRLFTPPADVIFLPDVFDPTTGDLVLSDPDPTDNCFENNLFATSFPPGIVSLFPCP